MDSARRLQRDEVEDFLRRSGYPDANIEQFALLGVGADQQHKSAAYGCPVHVRFQSAGRAHDVVFRTMRSDPFGHDRAADREDSMRLAYDTFNALPDHVRALDLGAIDAEGRLESAPRGEPFLVTTYVDGALYANDLERAARRSSANARDLARAKALADYLAGVHADPGEPAQYTRAVRDLIGHGEGIFGLVDSYPAADVVMTPERLQRYEFAILRWRWILRGHTDRCRRTHGDFHPFNILFDVADELSVLDRSRGGVGDPADDVAALTINFPFFALVATGHFDGALREIWDVFWARYLDRHGDPELLEMMAPFYAWRALVLASPVWYADIDDGVRDRIARFAERLLAGAAFDPSRISELVS